MKGYIEDIEEKTEHNSNFRQVLYTSQHLQLVVMALKPGEEIGTEVHTVTDQFFRVESGEGKVVIDGEETAIEDGDAVIVPAGCEHNIINTSPSEDLQLYTIYAPPHHKDGVVHATKAAAEADTTDYL